MVNSYQVRKRAREIEHWCDAYLRGMMSFSSLIEALKQKRWWCEFPLDNFEILKILKLVQSKEPPDIITEEEILDALGQTYEENYN